MTIKNHLSNDSGRASGVSGELDRLKSNSQASFDELRDFVSHMQGRSPQEVLGVVAQSGLTRGVLISTLFFAFLMAIGTVGPYYLAGGESEAKQARKEAAAAKDQADEADEADAAAAAQAETAPATADGSSATAGKSGNPITDDVKKMSETKGAAESDVPDIDALIEID